MHWDMILDKLEVIGTTLGATLFAIYITAKTFSAKLEKWRKEELHHVSGAVKEQSDLDCAIIDAAENLREYLSADRVQIYEFHNGTRYANGRSALKTTCSYETCRYSIKSCLNILSGLPLSVIPTFIHVLLDNGEILVNDIEEIKDKMPSTYNLKKSMDIKSFYDCVIYNKQNEPIGFIAVQFCSLKHPSIDTKDVKLFARFVESKVLTK